MIIESNSVELKQKKEAIQNYLNALNKLKELKIIVNQRDFTSQIGEWLIAYLYNGKLAENGKNKDWDMIVNGKKYQVKSHAKGINTKRTNTDFKYSNDSNFDYFVIVVFDEFYKLKTIYKLPKDEALKLKTSNTQDPVIKWKEIPSDFVLDLKKVFGKNELLCSFI